jgi:hypothetical protein
VHPLAHLTRGVRQGRRRGLPARAPGRSSRSSPM